MTVFVYFMVAIVTMNVFVWWSMGRQIRFFNGRIGSVEAKLEYPTQQVQRLTDTFGIIVKEELLEAASRIEERLDPTHVREPS